MFDDYFVTFLKSKMNYILKIGYISFKTDVFYRFYCKKVNNYVFKLS